MHFAQAGRAAAAFLLAGFLANLPAAETRNPVVISRPAPRYPDDLYRKKIEGRVVVEFIVGADGRVEAAQVIESTNHGFDRNAVQAVLQWKFHPGVKDGRKIRVRATQSMDFELPKRRQILPLELLSKTGSATVGYWLDSEGRLARVEVVKATTPVLGKAAVAILADELAYNPRRKPPAAGGRYDITYGFGEQETIQGKSAREIRKKLKSPKAAFLSEADLDAPLEVILQDPALFPVALRESNPDGRATVEFVIDEEGIVQGPRVIEATHEDFGYAAAQAIGQWQYRPPMHKAKPVIVRVRQTVEFARPPP